MNEGIYERLLAVVANRMQTFGLPADARVLACVSGGADSVCLLRVLLACGNPLGVFHLDHGTRGDASARDAAFVEDLTASHGLPFHRVARDVPAEAAASGKSLEEAGRDARYEAAAAIAREHGYDAIATAHHAGDQAETVLMRLIRGSGLKGLGGIPPVRHGEDPCIPIIRPLIDCARAEIEAALQEIGQHWCNDASNDALEHMRNRIRHELLPLLRTNYNPRIDDALVRLAESARVDDVLLEEHARDFLARCTTAAGAIDRAAFAADGLALQRRAAALLLARWGVEPGFERVEAVRRLIAEGKTGEAYEVDELHLYNNREVTEFSRGETVPLPTLPLAIPGETRIHGRMYRVRFRKPEEIGDARAYCSPARQVFDADAFLGDAAVRGREAGDRFRPLGLDGEQKLKDWFIDHGLTRLERAAQHLVTVDGNILWVVGRAIDARGAVTPSTRRILEIEVVE